MLRQAKSTKATPRSRVNKHAKAPMAKSFSTFKKVGAIKPPEKPVTPPPKAKPTEAAAKPAPKAPQAQATTTATPKPNSTQTDAAKPVADAAAAPKAPKSAPETTTKTTQTQQEQNAPVKAKAQTSPESSAPVEAKVETAAATTPSPKVAEKKPVITTTTDTNTTALVSGKPKTAILMLNMGGPEDPQETKSFLTNLFSDPMIINLGKFQWLGARGAANRTPKVQKQYETIGGSPIRKWTKAQGDALTDVLDIISPQSAPHKHYIGFRYAKPMMKQALEDIKKDGVERVIAFSQYPMYSCTTTGSSLNDLWTQAKEAGLDKIVDFSVIDRWHDNDNFHVAIAENIKQELVKIPTEELQHTAILFSAHSIPLKTMNAGDQYPAEISHTVEQTMVKLENLLQQNQDTKNTPKVPHILCWQSKVGFLPWLQPSTHTTIEKLKDQGFKQAIIVPVAFTSDHIETLHEIDIEYSELAQKNGVKLIRAESLNNSMHLTKAQANIVKAHIDKDEIVSSHQYRVKCQACVQPELCRTVLGYDEKDLFINKRQPKI